MTTIAYRDGIMAADSRVTAGTSICYEKDKCRLIRGWVVGASGTSCICSEFLDWFEAECKDGPKKPPESLLAKDNDAWPMTAIAISPKGQAWAFDGVGQPYKVRGKFFAIGSGSQVALGAMAMGADARKAVQVASQFDSCTGGTIKVLTKGGPQHG